MMGQTLAGKRIAILATDGFEQSELMEPQKALVAAGADVKVIALRVGQIQGMEHGTPGQKVTVDATVGDVSEADFSGLVLPGGVANPDELRTDQQAVSFVRAFFDAHKPVAAICHGPWTLIEADVVRNRSVTSWPSLRTDLTNAGARWSDTEVVVDHGLVTSRKPADLPAFCEKMIQEFGDDIGRFDLEAALEDPGLIFSEPKDILALHDVGNDVKLQILAQWERDARELSVAEDEGLGGGEENKLSRIGNAVRTIQPAGNSDVGSNTKHGN